MDIFGQTHYFAGTPKNALLFLFKEAVVAGHIFFLVHLAVPSSDGFSTSLDSAFLHFGRALKCMRWEKIPCKIN